MYQSFYINLTYCLVNGGWGSWSAYGKCSEKNGKCVKHRIRHCNNPKPKGDGKQCSGSSSEISTCADEMCIGKFDKIMSYFS